MSSTTRVSGHELLNEGAAFQRNPDPARRWPLRVEHNTVSGVGFGLCSCGARSGVLTSGNQRKAWHRTHKHEVAQA